MKGSGSDRRDQIGNRDTKNADVYKSHSVIRGKREAESYKYRYKIWGQEEFDSCRTHNRRTKFHHGNYHHTSRDTRKIKYNGFHDSAKGMKELIYCSQD